MSERLSCYQEPYLTAMFPEQVNDRHMQDYRDLGCLPCSRLGEAGLAVQSAPDLWLSHASVRHSILASFAFPLSDFLFSPPNRYGTFVFNGLLRPIIFAPSVNLHLPHEDELERTAEVPGDQGRTGYDVLPEEEEHRRS